MVLQRIWALVSREHLKITGFFLRFFFCSIISFKWEPGLWQSSYGGSLIQPKMPLVKWMNSQWEFIRTMSSAKATYSGWSMFELSAFPLVLVPIPIPILNYERSTQRTCACACFKTWLCVYLTVYLSDKKKSLLAVTVILLQPRLYYIFFSFPSLSFRRSCNEGLTFCHLWYYTYSKAHVLITIQIKVNTPPN